MVLEKFNFKIKIKYINNYSLIFTLHTQKIFLIIEEYQK